LNFWDVTVYIYNNGCLGFITNLHIFELPTNIIFKKIHVHMCFIWARKILIRVQILI
jgi:hypothetical protein